MKVFALFILTILLSSCSSSVGISPGPTPEWVDKKIGLYQSECFPNYPIFQQKVIEIKTEGKYEKKTSSHKTQGCSNQDKLFEETEKGRYIIGSESRGEGVEVDFIIENVDLVIVEGEIVEFSNYRRACGFGNWELKKTKNVTGLNCDGFKKMPASGDIFYNIFEIKEDGSLLFGDLTTGDTKTEESRPTSLGTSVFHKIK